MFESEILSYIENTGMLDLTYVQSLIKMSERKELLSKHPYKLWQGKDGKWYTYIYKEEKRYLKKRKTKEALENYLVEYMKEQLENPTVEEVFTEWNDRRLTMGKISASSHLRYFKLFGRHYGELGKRKVKSIKPSEIVDFLEEQIPSYHLSAKAFSNLKTITKGTFKRAKRRGLINWSIEEALYDLDVSETDFMLKIKEDYQEIFNDDERERIIEYLYDNLDLLNLGILLLFATGMRVGELMALKPEDIVDQNAIRIRRTETCYLGENGEYMRTVKDYPKTTAGVRTIIVTSNFSRVVILASNFAKGHEYVFEKNGQRMTVRALEARLHRVCKNLGIYPKSPHKIRKTYGSILLDNGVDHRLVLDQMGHTTISTTERHYHRNRRSIESKLEILESVPELGA